MAGVLYLAKIDTAREAVVIRDRDSRKNLALIEWVVRYGPGGEYRYSSERWAGEC